MRLLNAMSIRFRDFPNEACFPPYVILSHTWDAEQEVTFSDMASAYLTEKKGYSKITNTCRLALEHGFEWVWIDTCCIDKINHTELAESIQSMFRWYQFAHVCVVYLVDFTKTPLPETSTYAPDDLSCGLLTPQDSENIAKCLWFRRGWTLQELLAPTHVEFYDTAWTHIGSKARLCPLLSHITRIPENAILGTVDLAVYSTAQRMAWASSRVTTKIEDTAYSLLGLFDVNMPLIYGEGHRAFQRLQEEILKTSTDFTLFGWTPSEHEHENENERQCSTTACMPLMASSPSQFEECYDLEQFHDDDSEFRITNRGLRLTAHLVLIPVDNADTSRDNVGLGLSTATSSAIVRQKAAALDPPQHRYRYVLTIGKRRTDKNKKCVDIDEVGICLRKTGPGQLVREANRPLEEMSQTELRFVLNTTEAHTFYITMRPRGLGNASVRRPAYSSGANVALSEHRALHLGTQKPLGALDNSTHDASDWRNGLSTDDSMLPVTQPPPLSSLAPCPSPHAPCVLTYSDLLSHHPLRLFYHHRLLRGMYIPSLIDRGIVYGTFPQQPFDERLRIFCLPESPSEVVSFPCKSRQGKDNLSFSVLVDFRHGLSQPQCKVVDRSSIQGQFFSALSMQNEIDPMRWHMIDYELPDVAMSTNRLRIKSAHSEHTYEIVATAENGAVPIDDYMLLMPTLDINIIDVTEPVR